MVKNFLIVDEIKFLWRSIDQLWASSRESGCERNRDKSIVLLLGNSISNYYGQYFTDTIDVIILGEELSPIMWQFDEIKSVCRSLSCESRVLPRQFLRRSELGQKFIQRIEFQNLFDFELPPSYFPNTTHINRSFMALSGPKYDWLYLLHILYSSAHPFVILFNGRCASRISSKCVTARDGRDSRLSTYNIFGFLISLNYSMLSNL